MISGKRVKTIRRTITDSRISRLREALKGIRSLLILSHNNPDPDAIAAMWGLKRLLETVSNLQIRLAYSGIMGRAENRALIASLGIQLERVEEMHQTVDGVFLVDCQPGGGNVTLPAETIVLGVIDHHPRQQTLRGIPFVDVRTSFGSCIALLWEYWLEAGIAPDRLTKTLFYYAIRSETQELGREAGHKDRKLFRMLAPSVDWELMHRIIHAPVPRSYYVTFKMALEHSRLYKDALFADAGELPIPDAAAEIADWLLRLDEVKWALACGSYRGRLLFSLRTWTLDSHCGTMSQQIVRDWGTAGGHGLMAGGQIIFPHHHGYDRAGAVRELERRFLEVVNYSDVTPLSDPFAIIPGGLSISSKPDAEPNSLSG
jgi:nanoRNase/pAp phosphatase (c-di-AMP/oligoRNAs hydrolase)